SRTDQQIAAAIVRGQGMMPAFGDRIAPQGVAALVGYIRAFGEAAARARGMGGADGADGGEGESEAPESGEAPSEGGESASEAAGEAAADPAAAATAE
ncbi:MAG TPA: hypothetical protein RMI62_07740, partial [Polyangiaceae bacterium LLY-WYZ-15_(1-7)]|nr:hypothetical protein [Polyangiaceae bacterium LLY-WYZ-15_(1-7)]